jgi:hypothetical protein
MGEHERSRAIVETLAPHHTYAVPIGHALFHTCSGELDLAAQWFEKAIEKRYSLVAAYLQSPISEPLRSSPHWTRLATLINLPSGQR